MRRIPLALAAATAAALTAALTAGCTAGSGTATTALPPQASSSAAASPAQASPSSAATPSASAAATVAAQTLPEGYDPSRDAAADIKAALATAAARHQEVLIDFGADWCPDCKVLEQLFRTPEVKPLLAANYQVVSVDVGKFDHNLDLAAKYLDLQTAGIPGLVVLGADGKVRVATSDGSFSDARTMQPGQVAAFLTRWAPGAGQ
jgi:thiol:disulfide interchange protein